MRKILFISILILVIVSSVLMLIFSSENKEEDLVAVINSSIEVEGIKLNMNMYDVIKIIGNNYLFFEGYEGNSYQYEIYKIDFAVDLSNQVFSIRSENPKHKILGISVGDTVRKCISALEQAVSSLQGAISLQYIIYRI